MPGRAIFAFVAPFLVVGSYARWSAAQPPPDAPREVKNRTTVAVMDLSGDERIGAEMLRSLTALIPQTLKELGAFEAISSAEIRQMLELEATKQSLGCEDTTCFAELGGALGADVMISGSLLLAGDTYLLQMQLVEVKEARVRERVSREYRGGPKGLFDEVRNGTKVLVRELLAERSGTLRLTVSEEGATVRIDGRIVGSSPMAPFSIAGGTHTVAIEKEGFIAWSRDVDVAAKKESGLTVGLQPSEEYKRQYEAGAGRTRLLAWGGIGLGGAGLIAGGVLFALARAQASDLRADIAEYAASVPRDPEVYDELQARRRSIGGLDGGMVAATAVGLAALATGVTLLIAGDDPSLYRAETRVEAGPSATLQLAPGWLGVGGRF